MDKLKDINEVLGEAAIFEMLAEECTELAHAALKASRILRGENPTPKTMEDILPAIEEDMADVLLCMDCATETGLITNSGLESMMIFKCDRWIKRLNEVDGTV